jgi:hypothetical protein
MVARLIIGDGFAATRHFAVAVPTAQFHVKRQRPICGFQSLNVSRETGNLRKLAGFT